MRRSNKKSPSYGEGVGVGLFLFCLRNDILVLLYSLANGALASLLLLSIWSSNLNTCQLGVDQDTTTILTNDNLLVHLDIELTLGWNLVEATTTGITLYINNTQTIAGIATDALE